MDYRRPAPRRRRASRRRKQRKRFIRRIIPLTIFLSVILIGVIVVASSGFISDLAYTDKKADISEYIGETSDSKAILVKDGIYTEESVALIDGVPYVDYDTVKESYIGRFYHDEQNDEILYTNATETIRTQIGSSSYGVTGTENILSVPTTTVRGETLYVSLEYMSLYKTLGYTLKGGIDGTPYRIEINDEAAMVNTASLREDRAIRIEPSKKGKVVIKPGKNALVRILSPAEGEEIAEGWVKVQTDDLYIGYIEQKHLTPSTMTALNVNEVEELYIPSVADDNTEKIVLGWAVTAGVAGNEYIVDLLDDTQGMNVVSPTWFNLKDDDGNIESFASQEFVSKAHSKGLKVWGMVDNFTHKEITTAFILSDTAKREKIISQLISYAKQYNLDGINIDFESLKEEAGEPFIQFIRELSIETRANNLVLSVDNYVPKVYTSLYNRKEQGIFADYVIIMGYDEHVNSSEEAGSVASISYVEEGIVNTLEEVKSNKVINALPFYTRIYMTKKISEADMAMASLDADGNPIPYKVTSVQTVRMQSAINAAKENDATISWDDTTKQNYAEWTKGDITAKVWLEDESSLDEKLKVMAKYDLAGAAAWQIDFSEPYAWRAIRNYY